MSNEIKATDYELKKCGKQYSVWKNSKVVSKGFNDIESALQSVWVIDGENPNEFYVEHDGQIARVVRDKL